jgi:hypothetical protein
VWWCVETDGLSVAQVSEEANVRDEEEEVEGERQTFEELDTPASHPSS